MNRCQNKTSLLLILSMAESLSDALFVLSARAAAVYAPRRALYCFGRENLVAMLRSLVLSSDFLPMLLKRPTPTDSSPSVWSWMRLPSVI